MSRRDWPVRTVSSLIAVAIVGWWWWDRRAPFVWLADLQADLFGGFYSPTLTATVLLVGVLALLIPLEPLWLRLLKVENPEGSPRWQHYSEWLRRNERLARWVAGGVLFAVLGLYAAWERARDGEQIDVPIEAFQPGGEVGSTRVWTEARPVSGRHVVHGTPPEVFIPLVPPGWTEAAPVALVLVMEQAEAVRADFEFGEGRWRVQGRLVDERLPERVERLMRTEGRLTLSEPYHLLRYAPPQAERSPSLPPVFALGLLAGLGVVLFALKS